MFVVVYQLVHFLEVDPSKMLPYIDIYARYFAYKKVEQDLAKSGGLMDIIFQPLVR